MKSGIAVREAQEIVLEAAGLLPSETIVGAAALGRVLAEDVASERTLPPADYSAMDGYAVRARELSGASQGAPVELPVGYEIPAGDRSPRPLPPGQAARILTGAPVPSGCDAVVRQEDADRQDDRVRFRVEPRPGDHVRRAGEDVETGETVMSAGTLLRAPHLGMLAALGRSVVAVRQQPRVALLSGGDELVEPDRAVTGDRIVSSNSYSLAAQCREVGAEPVYLGIARDTPDDVERHLRAGLRCDVLVSSAGVSVGDHDYVRGALEKLGCRLVFWGVRMKPGFPVAFGRFEDSVGPLVFGLPGSPVSAMVTFELFVRPVLLRMLGLRRVFRPVVEARLGETLAKSPGRLHLVRVGLERRGSDWVAIPTGNHSSGVLRSLTQAAGLLVFPAEASRLEAGSLAQVQVLDPAFFQTEESGL
jgi:molybdopterin molybdotransferase